MLQDPPVEKQFFVTVLTKKTDHIYYERGSNLGYYLFELTGEGLELVKMPLKLKESRYYKFYFQGFEKSVPEPYKSGQVGIEDHPFYITTSSVGQDISNAVLSISNNLGHTEGFWRVIISSFQVKKLMLEPLFFQCATHPNMGGPIQIIPQQKEFQPRKNSLERINLVQEYKFHLIFQNLQAVTCIIQSPWEENVFFIAEQSGYIMKVDRSNGKISMSIDVTGYVSQLGIDFNHDYDERGLLGMAVHSSHPNIFWIYYTTLSKGKVVNCISLFKPQKESEPSTIVSSDFEETILMRMERPNQKAKNHNSGTMFMDESTNTLFVGVGDGTVPMSAQANESYYGKILSINIHLQIDDQLDTLIYAKGFRNPWGITSLNGASRMKLQNQNSNGIVVCDVGKEFEEINVITSPGKNFGWPIKEGNLQRWQKFMGIGRMIDPIARFNHDEMQAIIGGHFYNNSKYPTLYGKVSYYLFLTISSIFLVIITVLYGQSMKIFLLRELNLYKNLRKFLNSGRVNMCVILELIEIIIDYCLPLNRNQVKNNRANHIYTYCKYIQFQE